jgi:hypothetical protein
MDLGTPGATKLVGAISLAVVAALGWTLVVGPETGALSDARSEVTTTRDQNVLLAAQLTQLERQRQDLGATRRTASRLAGLFPPTADQPGLFEQVTAAAVDAGIGPEGVTTLTPTPPTVGDGSAAPADATDPATDPAAGDRLARQSVTVSVSGTFDETQRLQENLEHMSRAFLITAVSLAGDAESGAYTTTVSGEMFVMPPVEDPGKTLNLSSTTQPEG